MNTSQWVSLSRLIFVAGFLTLLGSPNSAFAQTGTYQRKSTPEKTENPAPAKPADPVPAGACTAADAPKGGDDLSKKVDVSDLEQKYWAAKDTEFSVVQNRTYSKEKRFALSAGYGVLINDQYSKGSVYALHLNYYLTERMGVELQYNSMDSVDTKMTEEFVGRYGTAPGHNKPKRFMGAAFNWVPFYGKMSLLEKKILYFDMAISPVLGMMELERVYYGRSRDSVSTFTYGIDVSQHFFIDQHWGIRADLKTRFYNEDHYRAASPYGLEGSRSITQQILMIGLTYYH